MSRNKLVKSTRTFDEHLDNMLQVRDLKTVGTSDRDICKQLNIGQTTLQNYKKALIKEDAASLSPEAQNAKRCELDNQIQTVVQKLVTVENRIEHEHDEYVQHINNLVKKEDLDEQVKVKLRRYAKYPLSDLLEIKKLILQAVDLRTKVWGLERENRTSDGIQTNRKIVFQLNTKVEAETDKLNSIADTIIAGTNGLQKMSEETRN